jgi:tellurite resistance protein
MEHQDNVPILARLVRRGSGDAGPQAVSILALAAAAFGAQQPPDRTPPTGFDPATVALFEGLVECAYLVANADGVFDELEREAFERLVHASCGGVVSGRQISALLDDFEALLEEDGVDARLEAAASAFKRRVHAEEGLRVAVAMAHASSGVSDEERALIDRLASRCGLTGEDVAAAYAEVEAELARARA